MDKAKKELKQKLVDKFNIDFTDPEYTSGDKQLFYALLNESEDDYKGSQEECKILQAENNSLKQGVSDYETLKRRHVSKIHSLEEELVKVRSESDKVATSVRKIPFLGTDTLSYQSDFILRWKEHLKEWNDLVSDFQNKYLPVSKEAINSFILRVKNVEL